MEGAAGEGSCDDPAEGTGGKAERDDASAGILTEPDPEDAGLEPLTGPRGAESAELRGVARRCLAGGALAEEAGDRSRGHLRAMCPK